MTSNTMEYESCFNALNCTPTRAASASRTQPGSSRATPKRATPQGDRFIPQRSAMDIDVANFEITRANNPSENAGVNASPAKEEYKKELAASLGHGAKNKVLAFSSKAHPPADGAQSSLRVLYTHNRAAEQMPKRYSRHIPQARHHREPTASDLLTSHRPPVSLHRRPSASSTRPSCSTTTTCAHPPRPARRPAHTAAHPSLARHGRNLLDWNQNNVLGVALGDSIYLWNANDGSIQQLMQTQGEQTHVTSLSWVQEGNIASRRIALCGVCYAMLCRRATTWPWALPTRRYRSGTSRSSR